MVNDSYKMNFSKLHITRVVKATQKAALIETEDEQTQIWVPRSVLSTKTDKLLDQTYDIQEIFVADWWLKENDL